MFHVFRDSVNKVRNADLDPDGSGKTKSGKPFLCFHFITEFREYEYKMGDAIRPTRGKSLICAVSHIYNSRKQAFSSATTCTVLSTALLKPDSLDQLDRTFMKS